MKRIVPRILLVLLAIALLWGGAESRMHLRLSQEILNELERLRNFFSAHPVAFVSALCGLHALNSVANLPGAFTLINATAGFVLGFPLGCAVIYFVSMLEAAAGYWLGSRFSERPFVSRFRLRRDSRLAAILRRDDFLYLVLLRLTPVLPFGPLNFALGAVKVPFWLFFSATFVGEFFDVTLLTCAGASIGQAIGGSAWLGLGGTFAVLFALFWALRLLVPRRFAR